MDPKVTPPADITSLEADDKLKLLKWAEETKTYLRRQQAMDGNKRNIYAVIWGQCSLAIQAKVKQEKDYTSKHKDKDCAWLLNQIKSAIYKFDAKRDIFYSLVEAIATLEFTKQQKKTDEEFYDTFRSHVEAFEHFGGTIGNDDDLLDELRDEIDTEHPGDIPDVSSATAAQFKT